MITSDSPDPAAGHVAELARCHVRHAADLVTAAGVQAGEVLSDLGLAPDLLADGDATLPLGDYYRIRSYIAARVRDETCHMSARQLLPGSTDFVMGHLPPEGTLADAMKVVARSYNLLHGGEFNLVEVSEQGAIFCIDDRAFPYADGAGREQVLFAMETILLFLHALFTLVAPRQAIAGLNGIMVRRRPGDGAAPHLEIWPVPVTLGASRYEVAYGPDVVTTRVRFPEAERLSGEAVDAQIQRILQGRRMAAPGSTMAAVRDLIAGGVVEQTSVAQIMGISTATLRRRLTEEGSSFRRLRRDIIDQLARDLLAEGCQVASVAERLGFSDIRSFNRAFKSWNGMTPKAYQNGVAREGH